MKEIMEFAKVWCEEFENAKDHCGWNSPLIPEINFKGEDIYLKLVRSVGVDMKISRDECRVLHDFLHELLKRI